jgi:hypothetical protein
MKVVTYGRFKMSNRTRDGFVSAKLANDKGIRTVARSRFEVKIAQDGTVLMPSY